MPYALRRGPLRILATTFAVAMLDLAVGPKVLSKAASNNQGAAPPATKLGLYKTTELSAPPPVAVAGGLQCDSKGNIYLQYFASTQIITQTMMVHRSVDAPPLRRINVRSGKTSEFTVGAFEGYKKSSSLGFYVTPNGTVYSFACGLGSDSEPEGYCAWLVTKYDDDGSVDSTIKLRMPRGANFQPSRFAAFGTGNILVAGFTVDRGKGVRPFTGIFDASGEFVTNLSLPNDIAPGPAPTQEPDDSLGKAPASPTAAKEKRAWNLFSTAIGGTHIVGAPDGTLYLLRAGSPEMLYDLSPIGEILRQQAITSPTSGTSPVDLSLNGQGDLFIYYTHVATGEGTSTKPALALVDPQSGKIISTYEAPPTAGVPACMTDTGDILFVQESKSGRLAVAEYSPQ